MDRARQSPSMAAGSGARKTSKSIIARQPSLGHAEVLKALPDFISASTPPMVSC